MGFQQIRPDGLQQWDCKGVVREECERSSRMEFERGMSRILRNVNGSAT